MRAVAASKESQSTATAMAIAIAIGTAPVLEVAAGVTRSNSWTVDGYLAAGRQREGEGEGEGSKGQRRAADGSRKRPGRWNSELPATRSILVPVVRERPCLVLCRP